MIDLLYLSPSTGSAGRKHFFLLKFKLIILNPRMQKAELPSTGSAARATLSESVGENLE